MKAEGEFWQGYWIDSTRRGKKVYPRLRWHRGRDPQGKELSPGCESLNTPELLAEARAGIERGKRVAVLERKLGEVGVELAKKRKIARELGVL